MARFEYELLNLKRTPGKDDHAFHWESHIHGHVGKPMELGDILNMRGENGWHISTHVIDARWGNIIVLERQVGESDSAPPQNPPAVAPISISPAPDTIAPHIQALSKELTDSARQSTHSISEGFQAISLDLQRSQAQTGAMFQEFQSSFLAQCAAMPAPSTTPVYVSPPAVDFSPLIVHLEALGEKLDAQCRLLKPAPILEQQSTLFSWMRFQKWFSSFLTVRLRANGNLLTDNST